MPEKKLSDEMNNNEITKMFGVEEEGVAPGGHEEMEGPGHEEAPGLGATEDDGSGASVAEEFLAGEAELGHAELSSRGARRAAPY